MNKLRSVNTHFWEDTYIMELEPEERLVFLYLITNANTNMLGVYEIHERKISLQTGIPLESLRKALKGFERADKVAYSSGFIIMKNYFKHQNPNLNMQKSAINTFNELPSYVKQHPFLEPLTKALKGFIKASVSLRKEEYEVEVEIEDEYEVETEEEESVNAQKTSDHSHKLSVVEVHDLPSATIESDFYQDAEFLATHLKKSICRWDPQHKVNKSPPVITGWVKEIERAMRLDGRTPKQLKFIIDYLFQESSDTAEFWAPNIQSGKKLREKFDKIKHDIKRDIKPKKDKLSQNLSAFDNYETPPN